MLYKKPNVKEFTFFAANIATIIYNHTIKWAKGGSSMLKKAAIVFGVAFLAIGLLGYVPALAPTGSDGMPYLLGIFMVDSVHNIVHITSGVIALAAAASERYARLYFQIFGIVYGLVAILGFFGSPVLGFLHVNMGDNWLHVIIAVSSLLLGFGVFNAKNEATA